jgi:hypothetical protein
VLVVASIAQALLLSATTAHEVVDDAYTLATLGEDEAYYGYEYSKGTYINTKAHNKWAIDALKSIRTNMKGQHTEMKKQLQVRHMEIANHVGEDIADAQNALGSAIKGAQNQLGQQIVAAQNALGEYIVASENTSGEAIIGAQNYITLQHNKLFSWLHGSLCALFARDGVTCESVIGPLEENQSFIPVAFHWPEGQPTMIERLEQIQRAISIDTTGGGSDVSSSKAKMEVVNSAAEMRAMMEKVESKVESKIDAVASKLDVQSVEMRTKIDDIQAKVDAMQAKVDDMQAVVVKTVQEEMKNMKDMLSNLLQRDTDGI